MNNYILGISAYYHDSATALLKDGEIVAAAQEERFTRKKHDFSFPRNAIEYCLSEAGITTADINFVTFYDKPFLKFERILLTYIRYAPFGIRSFLKAMPLWLKDKIFLKEHIKEELAQRGTTPLKGSYPLILFSEHHQSHAASAFFPSPFPEAAILTMDGVGEWTTTSLGKGKTNKIELLEEIDFPHSLGLLYSAFTYYAGFRVNSGEYKLMGLAPFGEPKYVNIIKENLIDIKADGSFRLNMKYFDFPAGLTMTNNRFHELFDGPPRKPESQIRQKDMDIARSIQAVTEEVMLKCADHLYDITGSDNLCLAGGVALNCVGNGKILRESKFKNIWIQPAAGDAGGALGAAFMGWHHYLDNKREVNGKDDLQKGTYLGPAYEKETEAFVLENDGSCIKFSEDDLAKKVAQLIDEQNVVGLFNGRMEFGPRALGARSIIGDARSEDMQSKMNLKIKFRESFRPFAPSVLEEKLENYFDIKTKSPYMLLVCDVNENKINKESRNIKKEGVEKLKVKRSSIPAITHVDYSARIQSVTEDTNPLYYKIINEFDKLTGCPVIINTSFNVRGEPIVCTPEDAYRCFMCTEMDYLVMGPYLFAKKDQTSKDKYKLEEISRVLD
ncbi:MAG: carbamoyltransferase [Candidatus Zapsychrus exili]|nr:carbamoyltransferase [Candidatus Zapsychrus exili]